MSYLEHLSNGTASTIEQQRAATVIRTLKALQLMSPSKICGEFHFQNCHFCERMWCNDNTSSVKDELIKRNKEIEQLTEELDEKQSWIRANQKTIKQMIGEIDQLKDAKNKRIRKLYCQRNLLYKYAEIHGDKFFLYAPLEKEYLDLLNEIDMED